MIIVWMLSLWLPLADADPVANSMLAARELALKLDILEERAESDRAALVERYLVREVEQAEELFYTGVMAAQDFEDRYYAARRAHYAHASEKMEVEKVRAELKIVQDMIGGRQPDMREFWAAKGSQLEQQILQEKENQAFLRSKRSRLEELNRVDAVTDDVLERVEHRLEICEVELRNLALQLEFVQAQIR